MSSLDQSDNVLVQSFWFSEVFYVPATSLLKVSVGLFLFRFPMNKIQLWVIRGLIAGSCLFGVVFLFLLVLQCRPISFWWDLNPDHHGTCINPTAVIVCAYSISGLNSVADVCFAISPMIMVWGSAMPMRARIPVCVLIGFASM